MENKPSWLSKTFLRAAAGIEAFRHPERRSDPLSFSTWKAFTSWISDDGSNYSNEKVTSVTGSKITTVWGCLNVLGQEVASLPFQVKQETEEGRIPVRDNIFRLINKKPNRLENAWQFWYGMVFLGEGWGESFAYILRDGSGNPTELIRLKPWCVEPQIYDGELWYHISGQMIHSRDIFHYRTFVLDGPEGVSKIKYNANLMGLKMKQERYAAKSTGNKPPGFLHSKMALKNEQQGDIIKSWNGAVNGENVTGTPFLAGDVDYKQLMISPEAAEIVQMTEWTDQLTMSIWRIQPVMLSNHKNSNYSNAEQQNILHVKFTLIPILTCIEQECDEKLFSERNKTSATPKYTKFNTKGLLRGDTAAQTAYIQSLTTLGILNADEVRDWEDLPPQKDGNGKIGIGQKYYIQGAMVEKGKEMESQNLENQRMKNTLSELLNGYKINGNHAQ